MWNTQHLHYDHGRHHFSLGAVGVITTVWAPLPILVSKVVLPANNQQLATVTIEDAAAIIIITVSEYWAYCSPELKYEPHVNGNESNADDVNNNFLKPIFVNS